MTWSLGQVEASGRHSLTWGYGIHTGIPESFILWLPQNLLPKLKSLNHLPTLAYLQVSEVWVLWTSNSLTEICTGKCINASRYSEITNTDLHNVLSREKFLSHKLSPQLCEVGRVWIVMSFHSQENRGLKAGWLAQVSSLVHKRTHLSFMAFISEIRALAFIGSWDVWTMGRRGKGKSSWSWQVWFQLCFSQFV